MASRDTGLSLLRKGNKNKKLKTYTLNEDGLSGGLGMAGLAMSPLLGPAGMLLGVASTVVHVLDKHTDRIARAEEQKWMCLHDIVQDVLGAIKEDRAGERELRDVQLRMDHERARRQEQLLLVIILVGIAVVVVLLWR